MLSKTGRTSIPKNLNKIGLTLGEHCLEIWEGWENILNTENLPTAVKSAYIHSCRKKIISATDILLFYENNCNKKITIGSYGKNF